MPVRWAETNNRSFSSASSKSFKKGIIEEAGRNERNDTAGLGRNKMHNFFEYYEKDLAARETENLQNGFDLFLAKLFAKTNEYLPFIIAPIVAFVVFVNTVAPIATAAYSRGKLAGMISQSALFIRPLLLVIPTLPIYFIFDRLGVSSYNPLLWITVILCLAMADTMISQKLYLIEDNIFYVWGGSKYHYHSDCFGLANRRERIISDTFSSVEKFGLELCEICADRGLQGGRSELKRQIEGMQVNLE